MAISHTETFDLTNSFAQADLALPTALDERLTDALDGDHAYDIRTDIEREITAKIREHGVNTVTGEWYGDWDGPAIVTAILDRHGA